MKRIVNKLKLVMPSFFGDRLNLFYTLAFAPLVLIIYFYIKWPFGTVIPIFGFILIILKKHKLSLVHDADNLQKILGLLLILGSFFVYYAVAPFVPSAAYYGSANYTVYLVGLFLMFFELSALKEAFASLFLIAAATSSSFISAWLKPLLAPFANDFAHIVMNLLRILGVDANVRAMGNVAIIAFPSLLGKTVSTAFVYECMGISSTLVFSVILVVILFEDPSSFRARLTFSIAGLLGTFALNILRVTIILLADYYYGAEVGGTIHYVIGYALFSAWLACFFYIYSKRQTLHAKITTLRTHVMKALKKGGDT